MKRYLILSAGRSGSVYLALKLGRTVDSLPAYVHDIDQLRNLPVQHSHLMIDPDKTTSLQRVFSLRRDPVETILSMLLSRHYKMYHRSVSETPVPIEPVKFTNQAEIFSMCQDYVSWHTHYAQSLSSQDLVVFYENMIANLSDPGEVYERTYPNKQQLIINYDQTVDTINRWQNRMLDSQVGFVYHVNAYDILEFIR